MRGAAESYDKLAPSVGGAAGSWERLSGGPEGLNANELLAGPFQDRSREERTMQKITPFLWFNNQAEEAMNFYVSIFKNSKVGRVSRIEGAPGPQASVLTATFQIEGQEFMVLNGGPQFSFTPAISFYVNCETQEEVDYFWEKLSAGGKIDMCGWLKDKFGVSWQIIPEGLGRMLSDPDRVKSKRVMQAMLQMKKIDIKALQQAYEGT
jgi:predicted 3-demethylubiquinone-9 3-methyltransferase (glyoxalase superfamily)